MSEHLQNPEPIQVSEPMMEIIEEIAKKSPNVIIATIAPTVEDLDQEEDDDWNKHGLTPVVIAETRHIDIDTDEVVAESNIVAVPKGFDFSKVKSIHTIESDIAPFDDGNHSIPHEDVYDEVVDSVNTTLRDLGNATTEEAYTYGIEHLRKMKKDRPDDWIVGHIFGGSYDLWITEYNESERIYFGFASFGGLFDQDAEWGSVSIDEILGLGFPKPERDFYWTPCTLESLKFNTRMRASELGADVDDTPTISVTD